jgi:transketolase
VALTREKLGWKYPPFEIPKEIYQQWDARPRGEQAEQTWNQRFAAYQQQYPELAAELKRRMTARCRRTGAMRRTIISRNCRPSRRKLPAVKRRKMP